MDPTIEFLAKLKKLAATVESETAHLQQAFDNRNNDDVDSDTTTRAMRAFHEINREVNTLKGQIQEQLVKQKARENEVSSFIKNCRVTAQRVTQDIQALKEHWEKYGYQAPKDAQRTTGTKSQESEAEKEVADETEAKSAEEGGNQEDKEENEAVGGNQSSLPPMGGPPPVTDVLRTPQLSDFGLSEMQLKRVLAGAERCPEMPPMPEISISHPLLNTPGPPPVPITPKCALRMDDDELKTPQMHDFGISEHTRCLINDFTMDLFLKNNEKPQKPPQDVPAPPVISLMESFQAKENLESPEPPVFCTPWFKIKKTNHRSPPAESNDDPESPGQQINVPTTPEIPVFQTPYLKELLSAKKNLELDGPTQEFSLGTPRLREDFQEPSTPEMPDLSCVTQDICKLVSQAQLKKTTIAVVQPNIRTGNSTFPKAVTVPAVLDSEFQSLPTYLKLMTLNNLNKAIHNINKFLAECPGEKTEFQTEELRRIANVGTKTPVYILCLTELHRLTHVRGDMNTSVYKLSSHN